VNHAREDLQTYSKSAFNLAYKKPVIAELWMSTLKKSKTDAKSTTKNVMVEELFNWVITNHVMREISLTLTPPHQRVEEGWTDANGNVLDPRYKHLQRKRPARAAVLGKGVILEVWRDLQ